MSACVLCNRKMGRGTKLRLVIDWNKLEGVGLAHTGCIKKIEKYESLRFYPDKPITAGELFFAKPLRNFMLNIEDKYKGEKWPAYEFHQYLLASEALFKVSTREQWINLERVQTLTNHWLNGSKIISQDEYDELFNWIKSFNTSDKRIKEKS